MKKRELGFYWVKANDKWFVAEYTEGYNEDNYSWFIPGNECDTDDNYFDEIDENKIVRNG